LREKRLCPKILWSDPIIGRRREGPVRSADGLKPWPENPGRLASSISAAQGRNKPKIVAAISRGAVVIDDFMRIIIGNEWGIVDYNLNVSY
jgi:hypothetical protein